MSYWSATARHISIAAGVVPQSSWSFRPIAPALIISCKPSALELLPCKTIGQRNKCTGNMHTTLLEHLLMDFKLDKPPMHYTTEISIKSSVYAQHREHRNKDLLFHLLVTIVGKRVKRSGSDSVKCSYATWAYKQVKECSQNLKLHIVILLQ